jgi:hypothetical protein
LNERFRPTSFLLDKGVLREALRGLVQEELGLPLPGRQREAYDTVRAIIAEAAVAYVTQETYHILTRPQNAVVASTFLPYWWVLRPGKYLKRWARRLREERFSREDALILSNASFGMDEIHQTFGAEVVVTTDKAMKERYEAGFARIEQRFRRMTQRLKEPYCNALLPDVMTPEELLAALLR